MLLSASVSLAAALPLSLVMVAGPQIISAIFFATSEKWRSDSAAFIFGAAVSITIVVTASYLLTKGAVSNNSEGGSSSSGVDHGIVVALVVAMVYVFRRRKRTEPPKWMGKLQTATPRVTFVLGFLLLGVFPSDLVTSIGVGAHLANHGDPWSNALGFIVLALLLLSLPALLVLALGQRAHTLLPKIRDWMGSNSWVVGEAVLAFFVVIVLTG